MYGNTIPKQGFLLKKSRSLHMRVSHFVIKPASVVNSWNGAFCYGSVVDGLTLGFTLGSPHLTCFYICILYILQLKSMKAQL